MTTDAIITERRSTHGPFAAQFQFAQSLKQALRSTEGWERLDPVQREVLDMNAVKISRILHGNPMEPDHWADLAGYSRLGELFARGTTDQAGV